MPTALGQTSTVRRRPTPGFNPGLPAGIRVERQAAGSACRDRERGFALPVVLWLCALMALTASTFLWTSRTDALLIRQRTDLARARAAADAGVALALIGLSGVAPDSPWPRDGRVVASSFAGADLRVAVQDELGLVDVNEASADVLAALFRAVGAGAAASQAAAAAIIGWRDPPRLPRRVLEDLDDLARLPGVSAALRQRATPFLTVRNGTAAIDPVTAPRPVLQSLPDMPAWVADTMVAARESASILPGTLPLLNDPTLQGPPPRRFEIIRAKSRLPSGVSYVREVEIELRPDNATAYRVLTWRRSAPEPQGS